MLGSALHLVGGGYCQQGALILLLILPRASPVGVGVIATAGLEEGTAATHTSQAGKPSQPSDPPTVKQHRRWGLPTHKQPSTHTITDTQLPTEPMVSAEAHCQGQTCPSVCLHNGVGRHQRILGLLGLGVCLGSQGKDCTCFPYLGYLQGSAGKAGQRQAGGRDGCGQRTCLEEVGGARCWGRCGWRRERLSGSVRLHRGLAGSVQVLSWGS